MGIIQFDIRHPNGQREAIVVEGERALIGSASYCDVRLPMDQAAYEHVLIEAFGGTLRAEAKTDKPPATINDMPLTASPLSSDTVLGIGRIRLFVNFVPDFDASASVTAKKKNQANPAVQLGLVVMFGLVAYLLLMDDETVIAPPPAQAPQLFTDTAVECREKVPAAALAFAQEQQALGDTKRERLPFAASEGVAAVGLFEMAAACYETGGRPVEAREARNTADTLKADLVNDFRARRVRLSHVLAVKDYALARADVAVLQALAVDKKGPYVDWLAKTAEQLKGKK
jgi:hypothetical protein